MDFKPVSDEDTVKNEKPEYSFTASGLFYLIS